MYLKQLYVWRATIFITFLYSNMVFAQEAISIEDYRRAVGFLPENLINEKAFNVFIKPNWFADSSGVWYIHQQPGIKKYMKVTLPDHKKSPLFDHQKLAQILSDSLAAEINADDLPIDNLVYRNPAELLIHIKNKSFLLDTEHYRLSTPPKEMETNEFEVQSPDKKWIAYTDHYNLYLKSAETGEIKQLSTAGEKDYEYASWYGWADIIEGEDGERPKRFNVRWSKDSKWLFTNICDLRSAQKMFLLDWSVDTLYRPRLLSYYRGSPGDTGMVYLEPVFFNVNTGKEIKPDLPRSTHINNIGVTWLENPNTVLLSQTSRGYQHLNLYTFDLETENLKRVYSESSKTNIDNFTFELVKKSNRLFYLSEKSGWRQLYSLDLKTGEDIILTGDQYYINNIVRIDEENKRIFFSASGKEYGRNPYYQHLHSMSFDGNKLKLLTHEDRHHQISISPDGKYFVDNFSTVNIQTSTVLRSTTSGKIILELGRASLSDLEGWNPPEIFTALAHDGKTTIYGALWKPTNFDPDKSYPLIESSYTGPHTQVFPKDFRSAFRLQPYAELGFVVMVVDGLGSSGRSKHFHDYSYKNLGGNLEDHVGAIRQLGKRYNWIDTTRVGIFGHSAGGYDAGHAVLAYPDMYKVAVASSADHDHRMEKAWWPEMYMGWPVDSAYHLQSNITMAGNLRGKLLITHGGIDENVNPSASFKLAEALIQADKQFDMLILPSQRHGYQGQQLKYFRKIRWNYFVEHLLDTEPIWDFTWE